MPLGSPGRKAVDAPVTGDSLNLVATDPAGPSKAMPPGGSATGVVPAHEVCPSSVGEATGSS
jgi:hypothetical protein